MRRSRLLGWVRRHLTYSNVIASLALFIALGGVSYAAIKIPANSVGTKQLKKGAVTGTKVKKGSLLARNFKSGQLPRGPRGERGPTGPPGEGSLFAGPLDNSGPTPSGDGWQVAQTVAGAPSGTYIVSMTSEYEIACPAGDDDCEFESGLRINGEFAEGSLYEFLTPVAPGTGTIRMFDGFGYYDLSGDTEISLIYRQVAGSPATIEALPGREGFYGVERVEELDQTFP